MKNNHTKKFILISTFLSCLVACKKTTNVDYTDATDIDSAVIETSDSISLAATQIVKDKKFIKTAEVNMEVKDVYDATIFIESELKNLGGFVTKSQMVAESISEDTYNISDENAILIRKFQNQNIMQVRVPTKNLGYFLEFVNQKKLFLNSRIITADDVTANIYFSKLEKERQTKTKENIAKLKSSQEKVILDDNNLSEANYQKYSDEILVDQLNYATVDILIKEPKTSIAKIPIANTKNIDNEYKYNFGYDLKNAFSKGFYLAQNIFIFLLSIWPILLVIMIFALIWKSKSSKQKTEIE